MTKSAVLHMLCGKIAAGKSTLTTQLGRQPETIVVSEDQWLSALYADDMVSVADYVRCSARLRQAMAPHLIALLQAGVSVVLDFPANTVVARNWMRDIFEQAGAAHCLHHLDVPDDVCKARLRARNALGEHAFAASDAEFNLISSHFVAPAPEEGFTVQIHGA
ncbi:AAA family ATPase [Novosphingobium rosa]|uniref:AAA family ATPase n=1 Tax=Novosphingobium rosa TaxID=76978 RepID=UPI0012ED84D4|nr:ATP-binding protein [Novosphingobium rosa]